MPAKHKRELLEDNEKFSVFSCYASPEKVRVQCKRCWRRKVVNNTIERVQYWAKYHECWCKNPNRKLSR